METMFKVINKKIIYNGFFKMNEIVLKYKKYDGTQKGMPIKHHRRI